LTDLRRDALLGVNADHVVKLGLLKSQFILDKLCAMRTTSSEHERTQINLKHVAYSDFEV